jgi:hypothetical protein
MKPPAPRLLLRAHAVDRIRQDVRDGLEEVHVVGRERARLLAVCAEDAERPAAALHDHRDAAGDAVLAQQVAALEAMLDLLEPRFGFGRFNAPPPKAGEDEATLRANRRAAALAAKTAAPAALPVEEPAPQPVLEERSEQRREEPAAAEETAMDTPIRTDARIDDVIESLSQALGASQPSRAPARDDDPAAEFERWTVRPRRTPQT